MAYLEQYLQLNAQCAIIAVTGFILTIFIKANIIPLDQELQTLIPTGSR